MEHGERTLLRVGVDRGYLDAEVAKAILAESKQCGRPVQELLLRRKVLSPRRLSRLRRHVRYRSMRKVDKRYGALAVKKGLLTKGQVKVSLDHQRQVFTQKRTCIRLGSHLMERGLLSLQQDRSLRAELGGSRVAESGGASDAPSSAATLALHEGSMGPTVTASSYRAIEEAVRRVDALRAIQQDLSTSDNVAGGDSANEIENALTVLARKRLGSKQVTAADLVRDERAEKKKAKKKAKKKTRAKKKTTGLMKIFNLGAA